MRFLILKNEELYGNQDCNESGMIIHAIGRENFVCLSNKKNETICLYYFILAIPGVLVECHTLKKLTCIKVSGVDFSCSSFSCTFPMKSSNIFCMMSTDFGLRKKQQHIRQTTGLLSDNFHVLIYIV